MNKKLIQIVAAIIIAIPNFLCGFYVSWPSYTLVALVSDHSPIGAKISPLEVNLIASVSVLGSLLATILVGYVIDVLGQRGSEVFTGSCFAVCLSIIAVATNGTQIIIGAFILGFANGLHGIVCMLIVVEFAEVPLRGFLCSIPVFGYCVGGLISFIMGMLCSYQFINYFTLTLAVVFHLLILWIKETPVYLLGQGKEKEALKSLKFYRGVFTEETPSDIYEEFVQLKKMRRRPIENLEKSYVPSENENLNKEDDIKEIDEQPKEKPWKILLNTKSYQRALVTVTLHIFLMVMIGTVAVQSFASQFFSKAAPTISPDLCSIALAVVITAGSGTSTAVSDLIGRRPLLIASSAVSSFLLAVLSSVLYWGWAPDWAAPVLILAFSFVFQVGPGCVPFVQLSECYMPQVKTLSSTISLCFMWLGNFIVLYGFHPLVEAVGLHGTFLIFSTFGLLLTISTGFIMKETRRVPQQKINEMFDTGYFCRYPIKDV